MGGIIGRVWLLYAKITKDDSWRVQNSPLYVIFMSWYTWRLLYFAVVLFAVPSERKPAVSLEETEIEGLVGASAFLGIDRQ